MTTPITGARYRSLDGDESCRVLALDAVKRQVLVLRDSGREWVDLADFNARWRLPRHTNRR